MRPTSLKLAIFILISIFNLSLFAQKDVKKYREESDALCKEVWSWDKAEFNIRNIPAEYSGASAVIIAKRVEIKTDEDRKIVKLGLGATAYRVVIVTEINRELIKINDKSTLSEYSEISFTQLEKTGSVDITTTYIGGKVIKSNGSVIELKSSDIVVTKDGEKHKEAKIAIPDLQVGDLLDYFEAKKIMQEDAPGSVVAEYAFSLFDVSPILNYSFRAEIGNKYAIEYRNYNGAPEFKQSKAENKTNVLELTATNVPAYPEMNFWISPYRQLPIIRMNILLPSKGLFAGRTNPRSAGEIYNYKNSDEFIEDEKIAIGNAKFPNARAVFMLKDYSDVPPITTEYFKELSKNKNNLSPDSLAAELFYIYRFNLLNFTPYNTIDEILNTNNTSINESQYAYQLSDFFKLADIDNKLVFVSPLNGPALEGVMSKAEIHYLVLIPGVKPLFVGMKDIFTPAFFIPQNYEDIRQAITLDTKGRKTFKPKDFDQGTVNVPATPAVQNIRIEKLIVNPVTSNEYLHIDRQTILRGHYKSDEQKRLILVEDYCNAERKMFGATETIVEELAKNKKSAKFAEELKTAFDQARSKQKDAFLEEAKDWFDQEVTDITDYKIENLGVRHTSPDFTYSSKFKMGGLIKKAGNNIIIEVGKLQGTPLNIDPDQRKRTLDIYMPFARSLQTQISLQIPEGYTVEGIEALNKKVENGAGYFISEASSNGKTISINIKKSYNNIIEPVANWPKLLAFIDAANDWTNSKLLFRKK